MITNITITCTTDDPNHAPVTLDLSTPGVSFFLEHLAHEISPSTPAAYSPDAPYDYNPPIAKCLKWLSTELQSHRAGEYAANREAREAISKYALDKIAEGTKQLAHNETVDWNGTTELPDEFKKTLFEMDDVLLAVGTSWKEIVEDFHKRMPMDEATMRRHLEAACYPEELVVWKFHA